MSEELEQDELIKIEEEAEQYGLTIDELNQLIEEHQEEISKSGLNTYEYIELVKHYENQIVNEMISSENELLGESVDNDSV